MNLKIFTFSLLILSMFSCKKETQNSDFTKTFAGKIDNKYPFHMKLNSKNEIISGTYYYDKIGVDIDIKGNIASDNSINLTEFDKKGKKTGLWIGKFINDNKISGTWVKPNGSSAKDFSLTLTSDNYENSKISKSKKIEPQFSISKVKVKNQLISTKNIRDLTITVYKNKEENKEEDLTGLLKIKNNKTNQEAIYPIELPDGENEDIAEWYVNFEDFNFDGKDEILILRGVPASFWRSGYRILDYNSLKPKKIFKKNKESSYTGNSKEKGEFTNIMNVGGKTSYEINEKNKTIEFVSGSGMNGYYVEFYKLNNGIYSLKYYERAEDEIITRVENGITTIKTRDME
ncbi:hypothetical protein [Tenacibaculum finnmarkense]|uniref:hypothetical protein n=1 Tax=Tenacibaculum finnmarkense TaxID=2781243 RepID=UPI001E46EA64|nr:hypothetical protein [Tenacibaculum finnmarkense]MCD8413022.1 hypothetical protein [Tenacibaculum finnmarkense genomovar ulcerans]MCG8207769.1 hypothetical protein [Tenacibaculum finnmarkense genomovar finnmarkense]MCG8723843.1 hypothetical protein [Tenacibaculum finnmarkense]MCG8742175.1 hypothetical protein [Tenacibaculum finnmarkense]MCG8765514.1 hypothetical protein [Tenacibaculum finnmarkense]